MFLELSERDKKQYDKLFVSKGDLIFAQDCCAFLVKKGWHHQPWERCHSTYVQQAAFTTAMITAYGRVFTTSKGWPHFPHKLMAYNVAEKELHKTLLELRYKVYAHSDQSSYEIRPCSSGGLETDIESNPSLRISAEDAKLFLAMTSKLIASINLRISELRATARRTTHWAG